MRSNGTERSGMLARPAASGLVQVLKDVCVYEGQGVPVERIHP